MSVYRGTTTGRNPSACRDVATNKVDVVLAFSEHIVGVKRQDTLNEYLISTVNVTEEKVPAILAQANQSKSVLISTWHSGH